MHGEEKHIRRNGCESGYQCIEFKKNVLFWILKGCKYEHEKDPQKMKNENLDMGCRITVDNV